MSLLLKTRFRLYWDYLAELAHIQKYEAPDKEEAEKRFSEALGNTQWLDIRVWGRVAGFLLIGRRPNCHPDADYYIEEAYISPKYRRQGRMVKAVKAFVCRHPGRYCLFVIDRNGPARRFWPKAFGELGYVPFELRDVGAGAPGCTQYGFGRRPT